MTAPPPTEPVMMRDLRGIARTTLPHVEGFTCFIRPENAAEMVAYVEGLQKQPAEPSAGQDLFICLEISSGLCRMEHCATCRKCAYHCGCPAPTKEGGL